MMVIEKGTFAAEYDLRPNYSRFLLDHPDGGGHDVEWSLGVVLGRLITPPK